VRLLGHSHGGFVILRYALDHPDRVAGLVLYSTTPTTTPEFWEPVLERVAAYPRRYPDIPEAAEVPGAWSLERGNTPEGVTAGFRAVLPIYFADFWGRRAEFEGLRSSVRCWPLPFAERGDREVDFRAELPSVTAPTLIITGRHDFLCGPAWARMLHDAMPGSRLVILEESGHMAHLEQPVAFAREVTWLLSRDGTGPGRSGNTAA
jgi:proline iminopeptidase